MSSPEEIIGKFVIYFFAVLGVVAAIAGIGLILAWPIKWTWNATMPYLFSLPVITWGKAWCLHFMAGCLIKATQTNNNNK